MTFNPIEIIGETLRPRNIEVFSRIIDEQVQRVTDARVIIEKNVDEIFGPENGQSAPAAVIGLANSEQPVDVYQQPKTDPAMDVDAQRRYVEQVFGSNEFDLAA